MRARVTYKNSGVDIAAASVFKKKIKSVVRSSFRKEVLKDIGSFGSFFKLSCKSFKEPVLVSSSDGVGTKLKIALLCGKHDTVGIDAVAMNVNDILCVGAEPLFFLDYIAYTKVKERVLVEVVKGINRGCVLSDCSLVGGETAQMPGMYRAGEYDIAGFCVGVVERSSIIDGSKIRPGDAVIGLASSGLHSNGYSLVRKALKPVGLKRYAAQLLIPTRIYVKEVLALLSSTKSKVSGIAHITGGSFYDKIARILPENTDVAIKKGSWPVPKIFRLIQKKGNIEDKEIFHTLNMGIGMVLIVRKGAEAQVRRKLKGMGLSSWLIGEVIKGKGRVQIH